MSAMEDKVLSILREFGDRDASGINRELRRRGEGMLSRPLRSAPQRLRHKGLMRYNGFTWEVR